MSNETVMADIESRCRFVFGHFGGRIGLTTDGTLANEARAALLITREYERTPGGVTEWEIHLKPPLQLAELMGTTGEG